MIKPSPPNKPLPSFFENSIPIETPLAAHKKASFWQINFPPNSFKSIGIIFPGYGDAKEICFLPIPSLVKTVINKLSPVKIRFPAENIFPKIPFS